MFREYDVRGIVGADLNEESVITLGRALGTYLQRQGIKRMALGRDCRLSSPRLARWLSQGLHATGVNTVDIGMVPTPVLYFATHHFHLPAGTMITGSHNPPQYNKSLLSSLCGLSNL